MKTICRFGVPDAQSPGSISDSKIHLDPVFGGLLLEPVSAESLENCWIFWPLTTIGVFNLGGRLLKRLETEAVSVSEE